MTDAIVAKALSKTYPGGVEAVSAVDLVVPRGEIHGFLGPNGAGKTTTISILTTLLRPSRGTAEIEGIDVAREPGRVRRQIGLVFQRPTADEVLTGTENLEIIAGLHGYSPRQARPRIAELLARLDLTEAADRAVRTYSGGMRRRLEIAAGLVHEPTVLFLDEPTLGLDPQGRAGFWGYLRELRARDGVTIFLTTHYLDEADQLSDRISIIDHGRVLRTGRPSAMKDELGRDVVLVRPVHDGLRALETLRAIPGVTAVAPPRGDGTFRVEVARGGSFVPSIVRACDAAGVELASIGTQQPTLDEVFLTVTGRAYREAGSGDEAPPAHPGAGR